MTHLLLIAIGLWFVVGLVLSIRHSIRESAEGGSSTYVGVLLGVLLAVPPELYLIGLALLSVAAWQAI